MLFFTTHAATHTDRYILQRDTYYREIHTTERYILQRDTYYRENREIHTTERYILQRDTYNRYILCMTDTY